MTASPLTRILNRTLCQRDHTFRWWRETYCPGIREITAYHYRLGHIPPPEAFWRGIWRYVDENAQLDRAVK